LARTLREADNAKRRYQIGAERSFASDLMAGTVSRSHARKLPFGVTTLRAAVWHATSALLNSAHLLAECPVQGYAGLCAVVMASESRLSQRVRTLAFEFLHSHRKLLCALRQLIDPAQQTASLLRQPHQFRGEPRAAID